MPICQGCGGSYEDSFKFCPYCGRAKPEAPKIEITVQVSEEVGKFSCPSCHRGNKVQKVSAIIASQTNSTGSQGSLLVKKLIDVPKKPLPIAESGTVLFLGSMFVIATILFLALGVMFARDEDIGAFISLLCFGVPALILGVRAFAYLAAAKKIMSHRQEMVDDFNQQTKRWELAMKRYEYLFYCSGCDCIFLPEQDTFAPVQEMATYLLAE